MANDIIGTSHTRRKQIENKLELQIPHQMQETSDEEKDCGTETRVLKVDLGPVLVEQVLVLEVDPELRSD